MQNPIEPSEIDNETPIKKHFLAWLKLEFDMGRKIRRSADEPVNQSAIDDLVDAQSTIMRLVATIPAQSHRDFVFKLAFWRWDAAEIDVGLESMQRSDAIVYSLFRDLVELTGEELVKTELDKNTDMFRGHEPIER